MGGVSAGAGAVVCMQPLNRYTSDQISLNNR